MTFPFDITINLSQSGIANVGNKTITVHGVDIPEHVDPLPKRWLRLCFSMTFRRMLTPLKCFSRNKVAPGAKKTEHIDPVSNSCFQKNGAC